MFLTLFESRNNNTQHNYEKIKFEMGVEKLDDKQIRRRYLKGN